ncbi:DUF1080 domain-containing protein [Verrucomicrobia bacterium LW23]|nr:DUF1080 domain-containing protein [Verrucomicrobia bacterium LW23]
MRAIAKTFYLSLCAIVVTLGLPSRGAADNPNMPGNNSDPKLTADGKWKVNDSARPRPPKAEPKPEAELAAASRPPQGAIILFDGSNLDAWKAPAPGKAPWTLQRALRPDDAGGWVESVPGAGGLVSAQAFGSCRLHVEWWVPDPPPGTRQNASNSGIFLMGQYEVQVLDNTRNDTYADGIAGAVYGQNPPSADASRPSGQWQYYDIEFQRPHFNSEGKLTRPATLSVTFNGVRVQDNFRLEGATGTRRNGYKPHADALPLMLQDHKCKVRFRNIWVVPVPDQPL